MSRGYRKYEKIRLLRPITIPSDGRTLVVDDPDDGVLTCQIEARDDYYAHEAAGFGPSVGRPLIFDIVDAINDEATTATYSIHPWTPSGSDLLDSGLEIRRDPMADFDLVFSSGSWTLDPRLIGYPSTQGADVTGGAVSFGSPLSLYGVWHSPHAPSDLRDGRTQSIYESSQRSKNPRRIAFSGPRRRRLRFFAVPGAHIREDGALDQETADKGGLPLNDTHNALMEFLWEGGLADTLIVDYEGDLGLPAPNALDASFEEVRFAPAAALEELMDELEDVPGQEQYSFEFALELTSDSPVYQDP